jgi:hypothetical protein
VELVEDCNTQHRKSGNVVGDQARRGPAECRNLRSRCEAKVGKVGLWFMHDSICDRKSVVVLCMELHFVLEAAADTKSLLSLLGNFVVMCLS